MRLVQLMKMILSIFLLLDTSLHCGFGASKLRNMAKKISTKFEHLWWLFLLNCLFYIQVPKISKLRPNLSRQIAIIQGKCPIHFTKDNYLSIDILGSANHIELNCISRYIQYLAMVFYAVFSCESSKKSAVYCSRRRRDGVEWT